MGKKYFGWNQTQSDKNLKIRDKPENSDKNSNNWIKPWKLKSNLTEVCPEGGARGEGWGHLHLKDFLLYHYWSFLSFRGKTAADWSHVAMSVSDLSDDSTSRTTLHTTDLYTTTVNTHNTHTRQDPTCSHSDSWERKTTTENWNQTRNHELDQWEPVTLCSQFAHLSALQRTVILKPWRIGANSSSPAEIMRWVLPSSGYFMLC